MVASTLSFGCLLLAYFVVCYGSLSPLVSGGGRTSTALLEYKALTQGAFVLGAVAAAFLWHKGRTPGHRRVAGLACLAVGYVAACVGSFLVLESRLTMMGVCLLGVGCAFRLVEWAGRFSRMRGPSVSRHVAASLAVASAAYALLCLLEDARFCVLLLGLALAFHEVLCVRTKGAREARPVSPGRADRSFGLLLPGVCVGVISLASSLLGSSILYPETSFAVQALLSSAANLCAAGGVAAMGKLAVGRTSRIMKAYLAMIPCLSTLLLLLPLVKQPFWMPVVVVANASYCLMFFLVVLDSAASEVSELASVRAVALLWSVASAASILGFAVSFVMQRLCDDLASVVAGAAFFLVYLLLLALFVVMVKRRCVRAGTSEGAALDVAMAACGILSARYKLSEREAQVLECLASGRNVPSIASSLHLSENTIWTYVKRVYRAFGVHSRQELLDVVQRERAAIFDERASD